MPSTERPDTHASERGVEHTPDAAPDAAPDRDDLLAAVEDGSVNRCREWLDRSDRANTIQTVSNLPDSDRAALVGLLDAEDAVDLLSMLPGNQVIDTIIELDAEKAAGIIQELSSDERADLIRSLDTEDAEAILTRLDEPMVADIRRLAAYDDDRAGSLMLSEYLAFRETDTVRELLADIEHNAEQYAGYNIQYTYVVDSAGLLHGVLPLRNVILARRATPVREVMIANPVSVVDTATLDEVREVFREYSFLGLPVVDAAGRLVGVIEASDVARADVEEADERYRQSQGIVGGEELRSMPLLLRSRRRLAWLSANIVLNIIAASMIALHQDTLEAVIALAVFLPIISDMSGCSGNQAVAVTMRELTLGVTRPKDLVRVLFKEVSLGLINGSVLGILIGTVAYLWKGSIVLSCVVGASLAFNTIIAVCIGGLVPLVLKRFKADPALASGPILTTITDMCGFFIVLTLASMVLTSLV